MLGYAGSGSAHLTNLVDVLRWRAIHEPDRVAFRFLLDGELDEVSLTYAQVDRRARAVASLLERQDARGERALLLYPPGFDYIVAFLGCLMAGVVAVPAYPPRRSRSLERLQAIVDDAQAKLVLTASPLLATITRATLQSAGLANVRFVVTDGVDERLADDWTQWSPGGDELAFLQYTSGSTGTPKGVMVTHGNLRHNLAGIAARAGLTPESQGVNWLPPYHDMGLIGGILEPLWAGFAIVELSPVDFLQRPARWLQALSRYRGTVSPAPTFAYDLCVRTIDERQRQSLDLRYWTVAVVGAEPVRPDVLERFIAAFAPCGFRRTSFFPSYGLAEGTVCVSIGTLLADAAGPFFKGASLAQNRVAVDPTGGLGSVALVGCGTGLPDQEIAIVNPVSVTRSAPDTVGEIWVAGPSVARGYYNHPDETKRDFQAYLADGAGPFLRTGDLGFVHDGELYVTGRIKDLIIIRGANYYPQDLEQTAEATHPALRPGAGAAFSVEVGGEEMVVVAYEVEREYRHPDVLAIAAAIRAAVSEEHGVHVYDVVLLRFASVPKTTSGKIQRRACRAAYLAGTLEVIGRSTVAPNVLAGDLAAAPDPGSHLTGALLRSLPAIERPDAVIDYLGELIAPLAEVTPGDLDLHRPLESYGFDSLMAVELCSRAEADLGVIITLDSLNPEVSISDLTALILARLAVGDGGRASRR
jgi:acyl-CoA synthetase (AMP-forming)/AMP-acid ligase II/acyl carrier protein